MNIANENSKRYLEDVKLRILQNLKTIDHAPSVQMHEVPPDFFTRQMESEERANPDVRFLGGRRQAPTELYEDDHDNENAGTARPNRA